MVNSNFQLAASAAVFILLLMLSIPSVARDWVPKNSTVILKYDTDTQYFKPDNTEDLSNTQIEEHLQSIEQLISESKYPTKSNLLLKARIYIQKINPLSSKLSVSQMDRLSLAKANLAQSEHQFEQAISHLSRITSQSNLYPQKLLVASRIYMLQNQLSEAEESCKKLLSYNIQASELCLLDTKVLSGAELAGVARSLNLLERRYKQVKTPLSRYFYQVKGSLHRVQEKYGTAQKSFNYQLDSAPVSQWYQWSDMAFANDNAHLVYDKIKQLTALANTSSDLEDGLIMRLARAERLTTEDNAFQELAKQKVKLRTLRKDKLHAADIAYYYLYVSPEPQLALKWSTINWSHVKEPGDKELLTKAQQLNQ